MYRGDKDAVRNPLRNIAASVWRSLKIKHKQMKKLVVLFVFVFIKANLYSNPPVTDFIAQINYINCDYAMAQFYYSVDTVFSDVISCWDFGDGVYYCNSYSNGASHNYSKPGIYSVTLKYIRNGDTIIISKPNLIVIRNPPIAEIDIDVNNKDSIFAPATIGFINKTKKGDGDTLSYLWSFGDSYISNDTNPIHTFIKPNTYYVDLKVTDNFGCSVTASDEIIVKDTAQRNEINYIVSSCSNYSTPPCGWDKHFVIQNDTLKIYGYIGGNCCTKKTATVSNKNDTIKIRTFEVGEECSCDCGFCFSISVPNVKKDSMIVSFNGQIFTATKILSTIKANPYINKIKIFPNPIISDFTIDYSSLNHSIFQIEIYNMYGQIVYKDKSVNKIDLKVNVNNFKSGLYFIRSFGDKSNIYLNKILINK